MSAGFSGSAPEIREIDRLSDLEPYRAAWNDLVSGAETRTVYQSFEWITSWWRCFGRRRRLAVLLLFERGALTGVAPLQIARKRINGWPERVLSFIGADNFASDYSDFIVPRGRPAVLEALLQRLWLGGGLWSMADLSAFPTHSAKFAAVEEQLRRPGLRVLRGEELEAPTIRMGDAAADARLVNKKSLKRHFNYFRSSGELVFRRRVGVDHNESLREPQAWTAVGSAADTPQHGDAGVASSVAGRLAARALRPRG